MKGMIPLSENCNTTLICYPYFNWRNTSHIIFQLPYYIGYYLPLWFFNLKRLLSSISKGEFLEAVGEVDRSMQPV